MCTTTSLSFPFAPFSTALHSLDKGAPLLHLRLLFMLLFLPLIHPGDAASPPPGRGTFYMHNHDRRDTGSAHTNNNKGVRRVGRRRARPPDRGTRCTSTSGGDDETPLSPPPSASLPLMEAAVVVGTWWMMMILALVVSDPGVGQYLVPRPGHHRDPGWYGLPVRACYPHSRPQVTVSWRVAPDILKNRLIVLISYCLLL